MICGAVVLLAFCFYRRSIAAMSSTTVAAAWENMPFLVNLAHGDGMLHYVNPKGQLTRRDVCNNADVLGPLIHELGNSAFHDVEISLPSGLRPCIKDIEKSVEEFFWRVRPREKPPVDGALPSLATCACLKEMW